MPGDIPGTRSSWSSLKNTAILWRGKSGSPTSCISAFGPCTGGSAISKKNCQKIDWISHSSHFFGIKLANNIYSVTSVNLCQSPSKNSPLFYPSSTDICFSYKMRRFYQYSLCLPCFFVHFYSFCALSAQKLLKYTVTKLNGRCTEEQPENLLLHSR